MSSFTKDYYRPGPHHRCGDDVNFGTVRKRFDFCSVQIGKWVTAEENTAAAGFFYDALCDLMHILDGPECLISLRGSLALQYGIGGRPGVMAHYDPARRSFSLAKNAGPGSIAHEWFHAFDHYIASRAFLQAERGEFASAAWLKGVEPVAHPLNGMLFDCYRSILLSPSGNGPSELMRASLAADEASSNLYFSKPEEASARAFEAFVQDAAIKNNFLVKGTRASEEARQGLYPQGTQRDSINKAFQRYFHTLGRALKG